MPKAEDFPNTAQGLEDFVEAKERWRAENPDAAEAPAPDAVQPGEQPARAEAQPEAPKPPEAPAAVQPVLPQALDERLNANPALKAALEADPQTRDMLMATARAAEAARPVLELIPTVEDAKFYTQQTNQFLDLQHKLAMAADVPALGEQGWNDFVGLFQVVDDQGKPVVDAAGRPQLAESFNFLTRKVSQGAMTAATEDAKGRLDAMQQKLGLAGLDDAQRTAKLATLGAADREALDDAQYDYAALRYAAALLNKDPEENELPPLPAGATPEQIAFQKKLEEQLEQQQQQRGANQKAQRQQQRAQLETRMRLDFGKGVGDYCQTELAARRERGEYVPDAILNQPWLNPQTRQATEFPDFPMRMAFALTAKIQANPQDNRRWQDLELKGPQAEQQRVAFHQEMRQKYLPGLVNDYLDTLTKGVREMVDQRAARQQRVQQVARVEPNTVAGAPAPARMNAEQVEQRAAELLKANPEYQRASRVDQHAMLIDKMEEIRAGKA